MNLDHLYYFKTLVETKSRVRTSENLAITPSALSLAIAKLERELNTKLFNRKRGSVCLTTDGQAFYEYVATALRFIDGGVKILEERNEGCVRSEITVGTVFSVQDKDWSEIIGRYRARTRGEVRLHVRQSTTPALLKDLKNRVVDVAFCGTMGKDLDVIFKPIWSQPATLVVNRRHPFAQYDALSLNDLQGHYIVSYSLSGPLAHELTDLVKDYDLLIDYLYSDEITLASIVSGSPDILAIACRSWLLNSYHDDVKLIEIKEAPEKFHQLFLCSKANISQPQNVALFIDVVDHYCRDKAE